jgi:hypothetical protein
MKKSEANQEHKSPVVNEKRSHPFAKDDNNINEKELRISDQISNEVEYLAKQLEKHSDKIKKKP